MKIAVMGTGAVGGYYGGMLARANYLVQFIARGNNAEVLKRDGLHIQSYQGDFHLPGVRVVDRLEDMETPDLILFAVKSTVTEEAAAQLAPFIGKTTAVLCLQNGVDNEEILAQKLGEERIIGGSAYISAAIIAPGVIRHDAAGAISIGEWSGDRPDRIERIHEMFRNAGVDCRIASNIVQTKWEKLVWNITFNPLTALTYAKVGDVLDHPDLRFVAESIMEEFTQVAQSKGIHLRDKVVANTFTNSESLRQHDTSMLQDRKVGKALELESICGSVIRWGKEAGVETPVLETVYRTLKFLTTK
jgi:2-dehydropantoate 2-reductase